MTNILKVAKEEISKLDGFIKKIDTFLVNAPKGGLKWQTKNGKTYYYHHYMIEDDKEANKNKVCDGRQRSSNESDKQYKRQYIKKSDAPLANALAQKHYYTTIRPIIEKKIQELNRFRKKYQKKELEEVYETLSIERKSLVVPLQVSVDEQVKRWREETYEPNNLYSENLRYETEQGELVRSKSEVIIANILYKHRQELLYKYERPLTLIVDGKEKIVYPDFTIMNVNTGKIIYWEHAGRMDDVHYVGDFVKKMNAYVANNLYIGKDVVLTFETQGNPLDIGIVRQLVKMMEDDIDN